MIGDRTHTHYRKEERKSLTMSSSFLEPQSPLRTYMMPGKSISRVGYTYRLTLPLIEVDMLDIMLDCFILDLFPGPSSYVVDGNSKIALKQVFEMRDGI